MWSVNIWFADGTTLIDHPLAPTSRSRSLDILCHVDGSIPATELAPSAPNGTGMLLNMHEMQITADGPVTKPQSVNTPVRHGAHLTLSDHERLRVFIHEFVMHGLIPWAEKTIRTLNEQVHLFTDYDDCLSELDNKIGHICTVLSTITFWRLDSSFWFLLPPLF